MSASHAATPELHSPLARRPTHTDQQNAFIGGNSATPGCAHDSTHCSMPWYVPATSTAHRACPCPAQTTSFSSITVGLVVHTGGAAVESATPYKWLRLFAPTRLSSRLDPTSPPTHTPTSLRSTTSHRWMSQSLTRTSSGLSTIWTPCWRWPAAQEISGARAIHQHLHPLSCHRRVVPCCTRAATMTAQSQAVVLHRVG